jgi:hypothetical protein
MVVLIGGDDRGVHLASFEQLPVVGGVEIRPGILGQFLGKTLVDIADAEPPHSRVILGEDRPDSADRSGSHYGQADLFALCLICFHTLSPVDSRSSCME